MDHRIDHSYQPNKPADMDKDAYEAYLKTLLRQAHTNSGEPPRASVAQGDPVNPDHYGSKAMDPIAYSLYHNLGFIESNVVKYVTRWQRKGGVVDLKKARECLNRLIVFVERV